MKFSNFPRKCYSTQAQNLTTQKCSIVTIATGPVSCNLLLLPKQRIAHSSKPSWEPLSPFLRVTSRRTLSSPLLCKFQATGKICGAVMLFSKRFLLLTSFWLLFVTLRSFMYTTYTKIWIWFKPINKLNYEELYPNLGATPKFRFKLVIGQKNLLMKNCIQTSVYLLLRFHVSRETCEAIHSPKETLQNLKSSYSASNASKMGQKWQLRLLLHLLAVWLGYYSETALIEVSLTALLWSIFLYFF